MILAKSIVEKYELLFKEYMIIPSSIPENEYKLIPVDSTKIIPRTASIDVNLVDDFILLLLFYMPAGNLDVLRIVYKL